MSEAIASILSTSSDTARMRLLAGNGDESVNEEVLQQFEALFLQQMLKSMRTASLGNGLFQSDQTEFYRDMYDQQIATDLAAKEVLGISQLINRQLGLNSNEGNAIDASEGQTAETKNLISNIEPLVSNYNAASVRPNSNQVEVVTQAIPAVQGVGEFEQNSSLHALAEIRLQPIEVAQDSARPFAFKPDSPEHFVDYAYELSKPAAQRLGVDAKVIIAIAALESGWGTHTPSNGDITSNNYFGIKADNRWQGPSVDSETLEFADGVFNKLKQSFRAYEDLSASFNDFAEFLLGNERYSRALGFAHDAKLFVQEIQKAGYATDPKYADKVLNVLNSDAFTGIRDGFIK